MTVRPGSGEVKQLVVGIFLSLGVASHALFGMKETAFVDCGRCIARCYRIEDLKAVWSVDDGTIEFYDAEGRLLERVNLLEEVAPQLMAA